MNHDLLLVIYTVNYWRPPTFGKLPVIPVELHAPTEIR